MPMDDDELIALLPGLDPAPGPELHGAGSYDGVRFAGLALTGSASDARFLECGLTGCDLEPTAPAWPSPRPPGHLPAGRTATPPRSRRSTAPGSTSSSPAAGSGALTAHGAGLTRVLFEGVTLDYLDLRGRRSTT